MPKQRDSGLSTSSFSTLLQEQQIIFESIRRSITSFHDTTSPSPARVSARLDYIKHQWERCLPLHTKLCQFAEEERDHPYFIENQFIDMESDMLDAVADMSEFVQRWGTPALSSGMANSSAAPPVPEAVRRQTQLPRINLPRFSGSYIEWPTFHDYFESLVINDLSFDNLQRFHYLKSSLEGAPASLISNIKVTGDHFGDAWTRLVQRYSNKRRIMTDHLSILFSLNAVTNKHSPNALRKLLDSAKSSIDALSTLGRPVSDDILIYILTERVDDATREAWELQISDSNTFPTFIEFERFLDVRIQALESVSSKPTIRNTTTAQSKSKISSHLAAAKPPHCIFCSGLHAIYKCTAFLAKTVSERIEFIKNRKICQNCLSDTHRGRPCGSRYSCFRCGKKHHSLLHQNSNMCFQNPTMTQALPSSSEPVDTTFVQAHFSTTPQSHVILATAWVIVEAKSHRRFMVRALFDQGSTHSFISSSLAHALNSKVYSISATVTGLGGENARRIDKMMPVSFESSHEHGSKISTDALIIDSLTNYAPQFRYPVSRWTHLQDLTLADHRPVDDTQIHAIIGADLYAYALRDGIRRGRSGEPIAQNTMFGWVLSGNTSETTKLPSRVHAHHFQFTSDLDLAIRKFWEIEEIPSVQSPSEEDTRCELHFRETHSRTSKGQYTVRVPFKTLVPISIGETRARAERCLLSLERRLMTRPAEREAYHEFLREYTQLGHMIPVLKDSPPDKQRVYFPHHPVIKPSSSTTKVRVVFNASAPSSNRTSFNDYIMTGPKLQKDLPVLHLTWRIHRYVYSADIEKMYRQILLDKRDRDFHRILWRDNASESIQEYQLQTLTFGTACAPFLAMRTLKQLAFDEGDAFPLGKQILLDRIFVDDALFGTDTIEKARIMRNQLISLFQKGGFTLRKWASNSSLLLDDLDTTNHGLACDKSLHSEDTIKILGVVWNPASDHYQFKVECPEISSITKRSILSTIAHLFDPLGWVSPIIVWAKIFLQTLWKLKLDWDTPVPTDLQTKWSTFCISLPHINSLVIPRWLGTDPSKTVGELHGFCDASLDAYAAVIYIRVVSPDKPTIIRLLCSKTKVAPIKQLSIPRLELCGAVLLSKLTSSFIQMPEFCNFKVYCWTDSTIVLSWLKHQSSHWKTFVANRVAEIHTLLPNSTWNHISGSDNPADVASRGLLASDIVTCTLWWCGPEWLKLNSKQWPFSRPDAIPDIELECKTHIATYKVKLPAYDGSDNIFSRFSSLTKLLRVIARILRWSPHWKKDLNKTFTSIFDARELHLVQDRCVQLIQSVQFADTISQIRNSTEGSFKRVRYQRELRSLTPFLDQDNLLRIGGRLDHSPFSYNEKHPLILKACHVAQLLIRDAHTRCLHGGISLTLSTLRSSFWIIQARKLIKSLIFHCIPCAKARTTIPTQLMSALPASRVMRPSRPFASCGVDYAGPIQIRMAGGRGYKSHSAYIAIFICFATKAAHLELVTDYSMTAFLAALYRFSARRGSPSTIYSDNGTNFVGAARELVRVFRQLVKDPVLHAHLAKDGITWSFIPPATPHFGGLWESGVKTVKKHMRSILGAHTPTFEELSTLLCKIEACMNSRPLLPLNDDPDSLEVLTPAHFLIGGPLSAIAQESVLDVSLNRLSRWQLMQQMLEQFWKRWSDDYIRSCQHRTKWQHPEMSMYVGQLVLLRNPALPPTKWELGRIVQCHPGSDGLVRVVTVKTASSQYQRPITKLARLPVDGIKGI